MPRKPASTKGSQVTVFHNILAKAIGQARLVSMARMAVTNSPLDLEMVTAGELQVPLVLLDPVLRRPWRLESQVHQALLGLPPRGQVPPAGALLQPPGLKLNKDSGNK